MWGANLVDDVLHCVGDTCVFYVSSWDAHGVSCDHMHETLLASAGFNPCGCEPTRTLWVVVVIPIIRTRLICR